MAGRLIADAFATLLGVPSPAQADLVFACQVRRETADWNAVLSPGVRFNNPLNLTTGNGRIVWPGQTGTYSGGNAAEWHGDFAAFGSIEAGAWACASNYSADTYLEVQRAFRGGDPIALATSIQDSPWDSGHYGGTFVEDVRAEIGTEEEMTDDDLKAALKRIYAGPDSPEEWVKADVRVMVQQDPETRAAIANIAVKAVGERLAG